MNVDILQIQAMQIRTLTTGVTMPTFRMEFTTLLAAKGATQHSSNGDGDELSLKSYCVPLSLYHTVWEFDVQRLKINSF